ncbi:hypothetical protein ACRAWD_26605 [Caulobacter segnis]
MPPSDVAEHRQAHLRIVRGSSQAWGTLVTDGAPCRAGRGARWHAVGGMKAVYEIVAPQHCGSGTSRRRHDRRGPAEDRWRSPRCSMTPSPWRSPRWGQDACQGQDRSGLRQRRLCTRQVHRPHRGGRAAVQEGGRRAGR